MMDCSDGLATDLGHICRESRVGARVDLDRLPVDVVGAAQRASEWLVAHAGAERSVFAAPDHARGMLTAIAGAGMSPRQFKRFSLPLDAAIQSNLRETTTRVLASLTPREERVLRMRFGIGMNTDHTLEEVGQQFSVTRERIRQIETKALRKLRHPLRGRALRAFVEN